MASGMNDPANIPSNHREVDTDAPSGLDHGLYERTKEVWFAGTHSDM